MADCYPDFNIYTGESLIEEDLSGIRARIAILEAEMDVVQAELISLDTRLDQAEQDIISLDTRLDQAEQDIISLDGRLDTAETDIISLDNRLDLVEADVSTLQSEMLTLQGEMITVQGEILSLQASAAAAVVSIAALQAQINLVESRYFRKDGSISATGNFDLAGYKIGNLLNGVNAQDALAYSQVLTVGSSNTLASGITASSLTTLGTQAEALEMGGFNISNVGTLTTGYISTHRMTGNLLMEQKELQQAGFITIYNQTKVDGNNLVEWRSPTDNSLIGYTRLAGGSTYIESDFLLTRANQSNITGLGTISNLTVGASLANQGTYYSMVLETQSYYDALPFPSANTIEVSKSLVAFNFSTNQTISSINFSGSWSGTTGRFGSLLTLVNNTQDLSPPISTVVINNSGNVWLGTSRTSITLQQKDTASFVYDATQSVWSLLSTTADVSSGFYLPIVGGTLTGALAMSSNKITGLGAATSNGDALRWEQVLSSSSTLASGITTSSIKTLGTDCNTIRFGTGQGVSWTPGFLVSEGFTQLYDEITNRLSLANYLGTNVYQAIDYGISGVGFEFKTAVDMDGNNIDDANRIGVGLPSVANQEITVDHRNNGAGSCIYLQGFANNTSDYAIQMKSATNISNIVYQRFDNSSGTQIGKVFRHPAGGYIGCDFVSLGSQESTLDMNTNSIIGVFNLTGRTTGDMTVSSGTSTNLVLSSDKAASTAVSINASNASGQIQLQNAGSNICSVSSTGLNMNSKKISSCYGIKADCFSAKAFYMYGADSTTPGNPGWYGTNEIRPVSSYHSCNFSIDRTLKTITMDSTFWRGDTDFVGSIFTIYNQTQSNKDILIDETGNIVLPYGITTITLTDLDQQATFQYGNNGKWLCIGGVWNSQS